MADPYLYESSSVLRNKLDIHDQQTLNLVEAEQSRVNMMLLYEQGFDVFSADGLRAIHRCLFGDIYEWAGEYRNINIEKRERLLGGRSVWYSNAVDIARDLELAFRTIRAVGWDQVSREEFVHHLADCFPRLWQIHPFREGNIRTVVMMLTFFVEEHGYYMDQELMAASAGYVRDAFVMTCLGEYAEREHLERILLDAVCDRPVIYDEDILDRDAAAGQQKERYRRYQTEDYAPQPHYRRD